MLRIGGPFHPAIPLGCPDRLSLTDIVLTGVKIGGLFDGFAI